MQDKFGIELQRSWVVELDSSSARKFSRHVIIQIPGAAFRSNFHVGAFVKELCEVPSNAESPDGEKMPRQELIVAKVRSVHVVVSSKCARPSRALLVSAMLRRGGTPAAPKV